MVGFQCPDLVEDALSAFFRIGDDVPLLQCGFVLLGVAEEQRGFTEEAMPLRFLDRFPRKEGSGTKADCKSKVRDTMASK